MLAKGATSNTKAIWNIIEDEQLDPNGLIFSNDWPNKTICAEIMPREMFLDYIKRSVIN